MHFCNKKDPPKKRETESLALLAAVDMYVC